MPEKKQPNVRFYSELAEKDPAALVKIAEDFRRTRKLEHPLERTFQLKRESVDVQNRLVTLSLSDETPVERWFGIEILGKQEGEVDLTRLNSQAPWLWMHDWMDQRGVIEKAWVEKGQGYKNKGQLMATVRLSRNPRGEELLNDMVDGIAVNVSIGYVVSQWEDQTGDKKEDIPTYRAVNWAVVEGSSVSVPANYAVGLGRSMEVGHKKEIPVMTPEELAAKERALAERERSLAEKETATITAVKSAGEAERTKERQRVAEINAIAVEFPNRKDVQDLCRKAVAEGTEPGSVGIAALKLMGRVAELDPSSQAANRSLGLTDKEKKRYSLRKALQQLATGGLSSVDGFEREMHQEMEQRGFSSKHEGIRVPFDVLGMQKRAMLSNDLLAGGEALVGTEMVGFIDLLRNKAKMFKAGVQMISGLKEDILMPRQTGASTLYWVAEGVAPTASAPTFGHIAMAPKEASAIIEVARKLLIQADPSVDNIILNDLLRVVQIGMDLAILAGTGVSGQPLGILNTTGIGSQTGGTLAYSHLAVAESAIATANADTDGMWWISTPGVRSIMRQRARFANTNTPLWGDDDTILCFKGDVTVQMPANTALAGDYTQAICALWGPGIEMTVNPYRKSDAGIICYQPWLDMDVAVRQVGAFEATTSIT